MFSPHKISPGGNAGVLDVFGLDPQRNYFMDTKNMLHIPFEWTEGREPLCLGGMEPHYTPQEVGWLGFKRPSFFCSCICYQHGMAYSYLTQPMDQIVTLQIYLALIEYGLDFPSFMAEN